MALRDEHVVRFVVQDDDGVEYEVQFGLADGIGAVLVARKLGEAGIKCRHIPPNGEGLIHGKRLENLGHVDCEICEIARRVSV